MRSPFTRSRLQQALLSLIALSATSLHAASFVYEGQLDDRGAPANGRYDIELAVYGDAELGATLSAPVVFNSVEVVAGRFRLDFEAGLEGSESAWVQLAVREAGSGGFSTIPGRTKATQAPAAIGACWSSVGDSGSNPATHFLGTSDVQALVLRTGNVQSLRLEPSEVLSGGLPITANVIAGSSGNSATSTVRGATISGGGEMPFNLNLVTDHYGSIGGGTANQAGNGAGTVLDSLYATVGGGNFNKALDFGSTVSGGVGNTASGGRSSVGGGIGNLASGYVSSVVGGLQNTASGAYAVVGGGRENCAGGNYSLAIGWRAKIRPGSASGATGAGCDGVSLSGDDGDVGTLVWADDQGIAFTSTGDNQFLVRANGGFGLNAAPLDANVEMTITSNAQGGDAPNLWLRQRSVNNNGVMVSAGNGTTNNAGLYIDHYNGAAQARRLALETDGSVLIRSNVTSANTGVTMASGAGSWSTLSDRRVKTAVVAIDPAQVLDQLAALPLSRWSYIAQGEAIRHIGPMAQDFAAAFGLGENDTTISTVDADGVALAAIQGLNTKLETENAALRADNQAIRRDLAELRALVESHRSGGR